ncbi:MAG: zinc transporter ZntB [Alphaproteobacteria bacterium]|nr:zinc transporter ZntB [Alphaproteobacteria bacterium]MCB9699479.1 zinc transporter ZntB [Alphaproteobacteria bacterium]
MPVALSAFQLDGRGGGTSIPLGASVDAAAGPVWIHLDYGDPEAVAWLRGEAALDPIVVEALLADAPRPRGLVVGDGLLVILRGINTNQDAEPEDMVSLRMWFEAHRVLTVRHRPIAAVRESVAQLALGAGPTDPGDVLQDITDRLLHRIGTRVQQIEDVVDELEEAVLRSESRHQRTRLAELRRDSIALRRYLAPQRETITRLHTERVSWLSDHARAQLREHADRVTRYVEALDSARERAAVTSEELSNRLAEQMNHTMYVLAIITAIFLPLGLITGLLGINVGGMPGEDSPWAFAAVTAALVVLGIGQYVWYRSRRIL